MNPVLVHGVGAGVTVLDAFAVLGKPATAVPPPQPACAASG